MTLLFMAAGLGSRFGGLKQMEPFGPHGESLLEYAVYDAIKAGFTTITFIVRRELEESFSAAVLSRLPSGVTTNLAFQELSDLPDAATSVGYDHRDKPWGTAHAVWCARHSVSEPFAVLNADDYYGPQAFQLLAQHLRQTTSDYAIVGYPLVDTLSPHGPVARGILAQDDEQRLLKIVERTKIVQLHDAKIINQVPEEAAMVLPTNALVSMNIMGFTTEIFAQLETALIKFLDMHGSDAASELYLPNVVGDLIAKKQATVRILPTGDKWFGVTYADDTQSVRNRLANLTSLGSYPTPLWS